MITELLNGHIVRYPDINVIHLMLPLLSVPGQPLCLLRLACQAATSGVGYLLASCMDLPGARWTCQSSGFPDK